MILEAYRPNMPGQPRYDKYRLFEKVGKEELNEGRAKFDTFGGQRINPYRQTAFQLPKAVRSGEEILYIVGHGGSTLLNGEGADVWAERLFRMGLESGDNVIIDITACYAGKDGDGFAASLTKALRDGNVRAAIVAPRGHIHETSTATRIFRDKDEFYREIWKRADLTPTKRSDILKQIASQMLRGLATERPGDYVAYGCALLTELSDKILGQLDEDVVTGAELRHAKQAIATLPSNVQSETTREVLLEVVEKGSEDIASSLMVFSKQYFGAAQPASVVNARTTVKFLAQEAWTVHKQIIETGDQTFADHAEVLRNPKQAFSTDDLDGSSDFAVQLLSWYAQGRWPDVQAFSTPQAAADLRLYCIKKGKMQGFMAGPVGFSIKAAQLRVQVDLRLNCVKQVPNQVDCQTSGTVRMLLQRGPAGFQLVSFVALQ